MTNGEQAQSRTAEITSLLRRAYGEQRDVTGWDRADFLGLGSVRDALIYSILFAPTFVEVEGLVFLDGLPPRPTDDLAMLAANIREARSKSSGDVAQLMARSNWLEVPYLFADRGASDQEVEALAHLIADAWRARLRGIYPSRSFEVRVLPASETGSDIGIGFVERLPE